MKVTDGGQLSEIFVSFQGEGLHAGRRHLFVRFAGCQLRCRYCDEPASLEARRSCRVVYPDGVRAVENPVAAAELARAVAALARLSPRLHAVALTGGEPLLQSEFIAGWLTRYPPAHPVLLETSATLPDRLASLLPLVNILSLDLKLPSNTGERGLWKEQEACLRLACDGFASAPAAASAQLAPRREVYVKIPVDDETDAAEVERGAEIVGRVAPGVALFLQPLVSPRDGRFLLSPGRLETFHALASRHCYDVRVLPQLHKVLGVP